MHSTDSPHDPAWWKGGVIYQIYPRSFQDSRGDGIGDLEGIVQRLDYLNGPGDDALGVDAIWLSPIYPSPMRDFGYDVADYCDIDSVFGDLAGFDLLVKEAHARNIRVVLDLVVNHSSDEHPWFRNSRASRTSDKRDWYIWRDPAPSGGPPTNWLSIFGGPGWCRDRTTGQYYYHSFLKEQPDLNWWNPKLREAVYDCMRFWMDRGVDGFRLDVVHFYVKDRHFRNNPRGLTGMSHGAVAYDRFKHLYDRDRPEIHDIFKEMRRVTDAYPDRMLVGEAPYEYGADMVASYLGNRDDELHMAFYFKFLLARWSARAYRDRIDRLYRAMPAGGWPCWALNNHDMPRSIDRLARPFEPVEVRRARARASAMILLTLRGTPFLYYGEELGMRNGRIPRDRIRDPLADLYWPLYKGRDMCRTPMQWDRGPNAGFSTAEPWLPVNPDPGDENVASQLAQPDSLLRYHQGLLKTRRAERALQYGSFQWIDGLPGSCLGYRRELDNECLQVLVNFSKSPAFFFCPPEPGSRWKILVSSLHGAPMGSEGPAGQTRLRPLEGVIMKKVNPSG